MPEPDSQLFSSLSPPSPPPEKPDTQVLSFHSGIVEQKEHASEDEIACRVET